MIFEEITQTFRTRTYYIRPGYASNPCGYVLLDEYDIPELQNLSIDDYAKVDDFIDMHGGCTWVGPIPGKECIWIGFDTNHWDDNFSTQNMQFAVDQCCEIIIQLLNHQESRVLR